MEKKYKAVINFKVHINEEVQGIGTWKNLNYTRQFIDKLKEDEKTLLEYYKMLVYYRLVAAYVDSEEIEKKFPMKNEDEIFLAVLPHLPPETAAYLLSLYKGEKNIDGQPHDDCMDLLRGQLGDLEITGADFIELKPGEND